MLRLLSTEHLHQTFRLEGLASISTQNELVLSNFDNFYTSLMLQYFL